MKTVLSMIFRVYQAIFKRPSAKDGRVLPVRAPQALTAILTAKPMVSHCFA